MKDPCDECIVKACCIDYCQTKLKYNAITVELYRKGTNVLLFEKAIDDAMRIYRKKHGEHDNMFTTKQVKNLVLSIGDKENDRGKQ